MAGVCQYSVEVKSRFSLFWDDSLNSEDPELLLLKLQNERTERSKKEKNCANQEKNLEAQTQDATLMKEVASKEKTVKVDTSEKIAEHQAPTAEMEPKRNQPPFRGRGGPRGYVRSFRGGRGFGPRGAPGETNAEANTELDAKRDSNVDTRGRGRGRGPRTFNRGRGMPYTDYRQSDNGRRSTSHQQTVVEKENTESEEVAVSPDGDVQHEETVKQDNTDAPEKTEAVEPEEVKCLTLEEYKALRMGSKPAVTLVSKETRKPNDGKNVFANMVPHRKIVEDSDEEVVVVEKVPVEDRTIDIDVTFADRHPPQGYGGSGGYNRGRGGRVRADRGSRGRGNFRGRGFGRGTSNDAHAAAPPVIYNDQEFPSLK